LCFPDLSCRFFFPCLDRLLALDLDDTDLSDEPDRDLDRLEYEPEDDADVDDSPSEPDEE